MALVTAGAIRRPSWTRFHVSGLPMSATLFSKHWFLTTYLLGSTWALQTARNGQFLIQELYWGTFLQKSSISAHPTHLCHFRHIGVRTLDKTFHCCWYKQIEIFGLCDSGLRCPDFTWAAQMSVILESCLIFSLPKATGVPLNQKMEINKKLEEFQLVACYLRSFKEKWHR